MSDYVKRSYSNELYRYGHVAVFKVKHSRAMQRVQELQGELHGGSLLDNSIEEEDLGLGRLFIENADSDADSGSEGWTAIKDEAVEGPEETDQDIVRLAQEGGPLRDILVKCGSKAKEASVNLQAHAIIAAFEAAGIARSAIQNQITMMAEDVGFMTNCDTVDRAIRLLLAKFPLIRATGEQMRVIKLAFMYGRVQGAEGRTLRALQERLRVPETQPIDRTMFAGGEGEYEDVPLEDNELTREPEDLLNPMADWQGY